MASRGRAQQRPETTGQDAEAAKRLSETVQRQRAEFEALPPKKQQEAKALARRLLSEERKARRARPSALALIAWRVYGIWVDWLAAEVQNPDPFRPTFEDLIARSRKGTPDERHL